MALMFYSNKNLAVKVNLCKQDLFFPHTQTGSCVLTTHLYSSEN